MIKKVLLSLVLLIGLLSVAHVTYADPSPSPSVSVSAASDSVDVGSFIGQIATAFSSFGGLPWAGKIALIITLLIASMKVSVLDSLVWDRLGKFQAWAAPILGLIGGIVSLAVSGHITLPGVLAYMSAGAGAILLHELLDTVKALPGIGQMWVSIIAAIEGALGGNAQGANV